jgi:hypothetical protein
MRRFLIVVVVAAAAIASAAPAGASTLHWCRQGDPPIRASTGTSCVLAGHIVTDYVTVCQRARSCQMGVPADSSRRYQIACQRAGGRVSGFVVCTGAPGDDIWARFTADI